MSVKSYMLDTNILIFMLRGLKHKDQASEIFQVGKRIRKRVQHGLQQGDVVGISAVTVCELEYGAEKSVNPDRERAGITKILAPFELFSFDAVSVPRYYAKARNCLELTGTPIGAMDLMIAAHALALGSVLVTNNTKEFSRVQDLKIENWAV